MRLFLCYLLLWAWLPLTSRAQSAPAAPLSTPAVNGQPWLISSGKLRRNFYFSVAPGASYALRFASPPGHRALRSVHLHFQPFGRDTAKVPVRVRIASVAATSSPADDDLLLASLLLTPATMQTLSQPLVLRWPAGQIALPPNGFFVVIEGVGDTPDEYVAGLSRPWSHSYNGYYQIGRHQQPGAPLRLLNRLSIPLLLSAKPTNTSVDFWMRGGDQPEWQRASDAKQVPLMEVVLE